MRTQTACSQCYVNRATRCPCERVKKLMQRRQLFYRGIERPCPGIHPNANSAAESPYSKIVAMLKRRLDASRKATGDPRSLGRGDELDAAMRRFPTIADVSKQQEGR